MSLQGPVTTSYRIEISGWDMSGTFFVENTELDWSDENGKMVYLLHRVREGALVFVRLIHPTAASYTFPVAYQVEKASPEAVGGRWGVHLAQLHPRPSVDGKQDPILVEALEDKRR